MECSGYGTKLLDDGSYRVFTIAQIILQTYPLNSIKQV
jgi:hypothetical protein